MSEIFLTQLDFSPDKSQYGRWSENKRCGFTAKTEVVAAEDLLDIRSRTAERTKTTRPPDVWSRKPPDFTPRVYDPRPPKRNSRDAIQPWKYVVKSYNNNMENNTPRLPPMTSRLPSSVTSRSAPVTSRPSSMTVAVRQEIEAFLVNLSEDGNKERDVEADFVTNFKILKPTDAKLLFIREGSFKKSPYTMPKHHDFRGYPPIASLGLPEFITDYPRDPLNINFHSQRLRTIHGPAVITPRIATSSGRQMAQYPVSRTPLWSKEMVLLRNDWPIKSAAYTRHRRLDRSAYSAKMERIEDALNKEWEQSKSTSSTGATSSTGSTGSKNEEELSKTYRAIVY